MLVAKVEEVATEICRPLPLPRLAYLTGAQLACVIHIRLDRTKPFGHIEKNDNNDYMYLILKEFGYSIIFFLSFKPSTSWGYESLNQANCSSLAKCRLTLHDNFSRCFSISLPIS